MQQAILYLLTIVSGVLNPMQSGLTSELQKVFERPFVVTSLSLALSLACSLTCALVSGQLAGSTERMADVPWWAWLAGLAGFGILLARPYASPVLGGAAFTGLTVASSVVFSVLLDHYGWLGFEQHSAGLPRLAGAALMIVGVVLVTLN